MAVSARRRAVPALPRASLGACRPRARRPLPPPASARLEGPPHRSRVRRGRDEHAGGLPATREQRPGHAAECLRQRRSRRSGPRLADDATRRPCRRAAARVQLAGAVAGQTLLQLRRAAAAALSSARCPSSSAGSSSAAAECAAPAREQVGVGARAGGPRARRRQTRAGRKLLHPLHLADANRADLAGGADVGAAAGAPVQAVDGRRSGACPRGRTACGARSPCAASSNLTLTGRFSATSALAAARPRPPGRGRRLPASRSSVEQSRGRSARSSSRRRTGRRSRRRAGAGRCAAACGRSGAAQSTRRATRSPAERRGEHVGDAVALVHDVQDGDARRGAGVERLAAGGGVEGGAVEVDPAAVGGPWPRRRRRRR